MLPNILFADDCDVWSDAIDETWISDRLKPHDYMEEPGVQFVKNLLRHSVLFERRATEAAVVQSVRAVLETDVRLSLLYGRRTDPGYGLQPLHDLQRRRGRPFHLCNAIWCLDEFTALNGTRAMGHLKVEASIAADR